MSIIKDSAIWLPWLYHIFFSVTWNSFFWNNSHSLSDHHLPSLQVSHSITLLLFSYKRMCPIMWPSISIILNLGYCGNCNYCLAVTLITFPLSDCGSSLLVDVRLFGQWNINNFDANRSLKYATHHGSLFVCQKYAIRKNIFQVRSCCPFGLSPKYVWLKKSFSQIAADL